jgi:hypothetical protein
MFKLYFRKLLYVSSVTAFAMVSSTAMSDVLVSRFGVLEEIHGRLWFNGTPVKPYIEGNLNFNLLVRNPDLKNVDIVLIQGNGGTACPALYRIATISPSGVRMSSEFGTCSDLINFSMNGDEIVFGLPRYDRLGVQRYYYYNYETADVK